MKSALLVCSVVLALVAVALAMPQVSQVFPAVNSDDKALEFLDLVKKEIDYRAAHPAEFDDTVKVPKWDCDPFAPSPQVPTSVHKLLPGDIKVCA